MRLIELIQQGPSWTDDNTTIYVEQPWFVGADAILVSPAPDTTVAVEREGKSYEYFLETFIAREFMEDFDGSIEEQCQRLIEYAKYDA